MCRPTRSYDKIHGGGVAYGGEPGTVFVDERLPRQRKDLSSREPGGAGEDRLRSI
jgi:hypothetical protein